MDMKFILYVIYKENRSYYQLKYNKISQINPQRFLKCNYSYNIFENEF